MVRVKRGNVARKRRKKILQLAKGYRGAHSRLSRSLYVRSIRVKDIYVPSSDATFLISLQAPSSQSHTLSTRHFLSTALKCVLVEQ